MVTSASPSAPADADLRLGFMCGVVAYALWGLFPIYLKALPPADPAEIVAHRVLWSVPFGAFVLGLRGQWRETFRALKNLRILVRLAFAAVLIAANWLVYVWAVANDRVLEASLGYYINPLIFIAMGVFVLKERLSRAQIAAVALAAAGVGALMIGAGVFPWPSFLLAISFTCYGYVRKTTKVGAMPGLFIETVVLSPLALLFLMHLQNIGALALGHVSATLDLLLFLAGPVTVVPLVLFALAARRLSLTMLGFLQYIGPTGQFILGLYYGEAFTLYHAVCFALIWAALALISIDAVKRSRRPA
ncbi:MAG: EamA family transporter RarD [Parvularculaceae bacterium]|nr:EamA family transporter RarD [Parvularculaceae bacterium]